MNRPFSARAIIITLLATSVIVVSGCATPPQPTSTRIGGAATDGTVPTATESSDAWDPLKGIDQSQIPTWVKQMYPLPAAKQLAPPSISETSFVGEWETAQSSVNEAGILATRLKQAGWRETEKKVTSESLSIRLSSAENTVDVWFFAQSIGGVNRLKVEIVATPKTAL